MSVASDPDLQAQYIVFVRTRPVVRLFGSGVSSLALSDKGLEDLAHKCDGLCVLAGTSIEGEQDRRLLFLDVTRAIEFTEAVSAGKLGDAVFARSSLPSLFWPDDEQPYQLPSSRLFFFSSTLDPHIDTSEPSALQLLMSSVHSQVKVWETLLALTGDAMATATTTATGVYSDEWVEALAGLDLSALGTGSDVAMAPPTASASETRLLAALEQEMKSSRSLHRQVEELRTAQEVGQRVEAQRSPAMEVDNDVAALQAKEQDEELNRLRISLEKAEQERDRLRQDHDKQRDKQRQQLRQLTEDRDAVQLLLEQRDLDNKGLQERAERSEEQTRGARAEIERLRRLSGQAASKPPPVASTPSSPVSSSPPNKPSTSASVGAASGAKNRTSPSPQTSPKHALSTPVIASFPLEKKTRTASPARPPPSPSSAIPSRRSTLSSPSALPTLSPHLAVQTTPHVPHASTTSSAQRPPTGSRISVRNPSLATPLSNPPPHQVGISSGGSAVSTGWQTSDTKKRAYVPPDVYASAAFPKKSRVQDLFYMGYHRFDPQRLAGKSRADFEAYIKRLEEEFAPIFLFVFRRSTLDDEIHTWTPKTTRDKLFKRIHDDWPKVA